MPYAKHTDRKAYEQRYYALNKHRILRLSKAWRTGNLKKSRWIDQRAHAKERGVEFEITFEQFVDFWGENFAFRGKGTDDLCMCRYDDQGSYRIGNIYMASGSENKSGPRPLPVPNF